MDGKADWLAAGLPTEGTNAGRPDARDVARADVPTCRPHEPIADVRARLREAAWDACVVVNDERVVFGLLREGELGASGDGPVERFMRPGPSTFRPKVSIQEMATFMTEHDLTSSPITSSDGRLVGLLRRDDAVRVATELHDHGHHGEAGAG
ncbi:MAG TPA: CBS domain-containing protein [Actinomycetota bacterium]|nr:CBS domain-containing protein [Actinomycetota bacterium]